MRSELLNQKDHNKEGLETKIRVSSISRIEYKHTIETGTTSLLIDALATAIPPTALVTDTAGVNIPSAMVKLHAY